MRRHRHLRLLAGAAALALLAVGLWGGLPGLAGAAAHLLPALLLALAILFRGYPGERLLLSLRARARRRAPADCAAPAGTGSPRALLPRGGRLIACALAVRPPPRAVAAAAA